MKSIFPIIFLFFLGTGLQAQFGSYGVTDARSLGMGNTYNATSYDLYAIGKNPGLLIKNDAPCKVTFIFPNLTAQQYGITQTLQTFDYYSSNKLRSDGLISIDKDKFRIALDNNGKIFVDALLGFFSAAYHPNERLGSFSFSMADYISGYLDIPDVILDINYGNEVGGGTFNLDNFTFKSWWIRTYALSYSRYVYKDRSLYRDHEGLITSVSAGITAKYVLSYVYNDIGLSANASYSNATQTLSGSYDATAVHSYSPDLALINNYQGQNEKPPGFMALEPAGRGFGIDIGAAAELKKGWTVGVAVTDIGTIAWKGDAATSTFNGSIDISGAIDNETIDSLATEISLQNESRENFNTPMPTAVRLGVALKFEEMIKNFPGELLMGLDYNQGLNNEPSNFTKPRFSTGLHYRYKPKWPVLLAGYTYDLLGINRVALGLGYQTWFMDVYVSTIDVIDIFSGGDRFSASLVARWKILCGYRKNKAPECF